MQPKRIVALLFSLAFITSSALAQTSKPLPYLDPSLPTQQRVDDLVSRMTLDEKVAQLINTTPAIPRLNVPAYDYWSEGLHGIAPLWLRHDVSAGHRYGGNLGMPHSSIKSPPSSPPRPAPNITRPVRHDVHSIYYGLTIWSPNINIFRDPRWGRGQETYGEDPFLTARLGVAFVKGLQGDDPTYFRTIATPKHYAVHSGPESTRHSANIDPTPHDLWDTYLPALPRHHRRRQGLLHHVRPITPSISTPPAPTRCFSRRSFAVIGSFRASSPPTVAPSMTSSKRRLTTPRLTKMQPLSTASRPAPDTNCGRTYLALTDAVKKGSHQRIADRRLTQASLPCPLQARPLRSAGKDALLQRPVF